MVPDDILRSEFVRSSRFEPPSGVESPFQIRNDYPSASDPRYVEHPWLDIDFKTEPKRYLEVVKDYCFLGMLENDFDATKNKERDWYHAPWMHLSALGREPIHGLTFEHPIPKYHLSHTQGRVLQNWACAYINEPAASVFGQIWLPDPAHPNWDSCVSFPRGSVSFKILLSDAKDEELPFMRGSPRWSALIARQPDNPEDRVQGTVRFMQLDVAAKDDRAENGWIFGTFIYDGRCVNSVNPQFPDPGWHRVIPVGLMWGNDPQLTQKEFEENGKRPVEQWINPAADELLRQLKGDRPSWGWNGRVNGPADNFISACASCHGVAQRIEVDVNAFDILKQPELVQNYKAQWIPRDDSETMLWFGNSGILGKDPGEISGDFNLQLMVGYNYFERLKYGIEMHPKRKYRNAS